MTEGEVIQRLNECRFRIGGSRFMAAKYPDRIQVSESTDHDFYCSNCPEHIDVLEECGFAVVDCPNRSYWDSQLLEMYKHKQFAIDCLIRKDVIFYARAFDSIAPDDFITHVWKSSPRNINMDEGEMLYFREDVCIFMNQLFSNMKTARKFTNDEIPF